MKLRLGPSGFHPAASALSGGGPVTACGKPPAAERALGARVSLLRPLPGGPWTAPRGASGRTGRVDPCRLATRGTSPRRASPRKKRHQPPSDRCVGGGLSPLLLDGLRRRPTALTPDCRAHSEERKPSSPRRLERSAEATASRRRWSSPVFGQVRMGHGSFKERLQKGYGRPVALREVPAKRQWGRSVAPGRVAFGEPLRGPCHAGRASLSPLPAGPQSGRPCRSERAARCAVRAALKPLLNPETPS
jgi:hypothetical protein